MARCYKTQLVHSLSYPADLLSRSLTIRGLRRYESGSAIQVEV